MNIENPTSLLTDLNALTIVPMLATVFGAITLLMLNVFTKTFSRSLNVLLCMIFVGISIMFVLNISTNNNYGFFDFIVFDGISSLTNIIILVSSLIFLPLILSKNRFDEFQNIEFYTLFLFVISGLGLMVSTNNLILILMSLECASLSIYAIIALHNTKKASEASIKYFIMSSIATSIYVFGAMLLYASTGSFDIKIIGESLYTSSATMIFSGFVFMLVAVGFKISLVPFHTWTPDVYEGSNSIFTGFMSVAPKIAGIIVALRIFDIFAQSEIQWVENIIFVFILITMTLPNIMALLQDNIKRMLAYSSISQAGIALACIFIATPQSHKALFLYWILFLFANLGAFAFLWAHEENDNKQSMFYQYCGLAKKSPVFAVMASIFMLSLAGIPPFGLFWGKMYIISSAINADELFLAVAIAINSAIAIFYYLKLIIFMFFKENEVGISHTNNSPAIKTIMIGMSGFCIFAIFFIQYLLDIIWAFIEPNVF